MANTPNYGWELPDVGGDVDTWGTILNDAVDDIDAQMFANNGAALQKTGGTMTGDIVLDTAEASTSSEVAGYKGLPNIAITGDYTPGLSDAGKAVVHTGSLHTFTIPANASVAFPVGTIINVVNDPTSSGNLNLTRAGGVSLYLVPLTTDANRAITAGGWCALHKIGTNKWLVSGGGVS